MKGTFYLTICLAFALFNITVSKLERNLIPVEKQMKRKPERMLKVTRAEKLTNPTQERNLGCNYFYIN